MVSIHAPQRSAMSHTTEPEFWHFSRPAIAGMAEHAQTLESQGWDGMSLTDSQNLSPDVYVALTIAAQATRRLFIGPGVTNPVTRHSAAAASAIAAVQALSGGRAVFGIGRGDSSLFNIGHKPASVAVFEPYLEAMQRYLSGESIDLNNYPSCLHWIAGLELPRIEIDVAATGPKVIAVGARHAERVSFAVGADPERARWAIQQLTAATPADQSPRSAGLYLNVCVHDDVQQACELVRPGVGIFAHFSGMSTTITDTVSTADGRVFAAIQSGYDKARHGHGDAAHAKALPVDFIERFAIVGPPDQCIERLRALVDEGITRFFIIGPRPDHFGELAQIATRRFAEEVIPAFKS